MIFCDSRSDTVKNRCVAKLCKPSSHTQLCRFQCMRMAWQTNIERHFKYSKGCGLEFSMTTQRKSLSITSNLNIKCGERRTRSLNNGIRTNGGVITLQVRNFRTDVGLVASVPSGQTSLRSSPHHRLQTAAAGAELLLAGVDSPAPSPLRCSQRRMTQTTDRERLKIERYKAPIISAL